MGRRRGVARTSFPRRRVFRVIAKWTEFSVPRRFKLLTPRMVPELDLELTVLDFLEQMCYRVLQMLGVDSGQWQYYVGYAKRLWEKAMSFLEETYLLERTSLQNEYVLRGLDQDVMSNLDDPVALAIEYKTTGRYPRFPPAWAYYNLIGSVDLREQGSYFWSTGGAVLYVEIPQGWGGGYFNRQ